MLQVSSCLSCAGVNQCCGQKARPLTGSVHIKLHHTPPVMQVSSCLNCGVSKANNSLSEASGRDAMPPRFLLGRTPRLPRFAHARTERGRGRESWSSELELLRASPLAVASCKRRSSSPVSGPSWSATSCMSSSTPRCRTPRPRPGRRARQPAAPATWRAHRCPCKWPGPPTR